MSLADVSTCEAVNDWVSSEVESMGGNGREFAYIEPPPPNPMERNERRKAYVSGVYFLMQGNEVVYVGQSVNVYSRISQHMAGAPFEFDSFSITECATADILVLEAQQIRDIQPRWNKMYPACGEAPYERRGSHCVGDGEFGGPK